MSKESKKVANKLSILIKKKLQEKMEQKIPIIFDITMNSYDINLTGAVISPQSRTNPEYLRDYFLERLMEHEFIKEESDSIKMCLPNMETFDFSGGKLRIIQTILEGVVGIYVEIDADQYEKMYKKKPRGLEAFDDAASKKDMLYIIRYTNDVRKREKILGKREKLIRYPWSNTTGVDIFKDANNYVDENISKWISEVVDDSIKEL